MKSIIGKIVDADLTVMNRFEKIVYGVTVFLVGMAGAFFGMYTFDFVSEASGLATYDSEDDFAGRLVVASSVCFRPAFPPHKEMPKAILRSRADEPPSNQQRNLEQPLVPSRPVSADRCLW